jgi:hypothetical protein
VVDRGIKETETPLELAVPDLLLEVFELLLAHFGFAAKVVGDDNLPIFGGLIVSVNLGAAARAAAQGCNGFSHFFLRFGLGSKNN